MRNRYGNPIRKFAIMNGAALYNPLARSLTNVERSSRKAGTYATAMKDMNAEPKKMALVKGPIDDWVVGSRSHTVPIMMARPIYIANRMP